MMPVAKPPEPKPASLAATSGAVRAALVFGGAMLAHLTLGLVQPHATDSPTIQWAMMAFAATCATGLVAMYVERAEGFRKVMLTLQLLCGLTVVILDSVYWVGLVMG